MQQAIKQQPKPEPKIFKTVLPPSKPMEYNQWVQYIHNAAATKQIQKAH